MGGDDWPRTVRLRDVPVRDFLESQDHQQDLIRELQLIQIGDRFDTTTAEVSHRVARLIGDILTRYAQVRNVTREQMVDALRRGDEVADLEVPVRPGMAEALQQWLLLLEEADGLCQHGELLLVATRPEIRDLRRWYVAAITAALDGGEEPQRAG